MKCGISEDATVHLLFDASSDSIIAQNGHFPKTMQDDLIWRYNRGRLYFKDISSQPTFPQYFKCRYHYHGLVMCMDSAVYYIPKRRRFHNGKFFVSCYGFALYCKRNGIMDRRLENVVYDDRIDTAKVEKLFSKPFKRKRSRFYEVYSKFKSFFYYFVRPNGPVE